MAATPGAKLVLIAAAAATVGCDRVTKFVAISTLAGEPERSLFADTLRLTYAENAGGFLSLGASLPPSLRTAVFTVATGALLVAMGVAAIRGRYGMWSRVGLALLVAGGLSNWIDRVARGSVVDFLNVGIGSLRTGIFNVADVAIMFGAAVVVASEIGGSRRRADSPSSSQVDA